MDYEEQNFDRKTTNKKVVLVGEQSLLIQCAEVLLANNMDILSIVSDSPAIIEWSHKNDLSTVSFQEFLGESQNFVCDYLFSITNLTMLPAHIISLARDMAINFHDGPLPKYAGLNTPSWAIIHGESEYGVTWHRMLKDADTGGLLEQERFLVSEEETSFTINAKCYEAAIASFIRLVDKLQEGTLVETAQNLNERSYFSKSSRPKAAATLLWEEGADAISRLVRALDWGHYFCPLGKAKLHLGHTTLLVSKVEVLDETQSLQEHLSGTLLSIDEAGLTVATATQDVYLSGITRIDGESINLPEFCQSMNIKTGVTLPVLVLSDQDDITSFNKELATHEKFWLRKLYQFETTELPYVKHQTAFLTSEYASVEWDARDVWQSGDVIFEDKIFYSFTLLLSRLSNSDSVDFGLKSSFHNFSLATLHDYFSEIVPVKINIDGEQSVKDSIEHVVSQKRSYENKKSFAFDLLARDRVANKQYEQLRKNILFTVVETSSDIDKISASLALVVISAEQRLFWKYDQAVFTANDIHALNNMLQSLLSTLQKNTDLVKNIAIINPDDARKIDQWNASDKAYDTNLCIHQLIELRSQQCSDESVALYCNGETLSYKALNNKANALAHELLELGVQGGDFVGVMVERSCSMVVAMLAAMKAGAAYVPLDPDYPHDRLRYMIQDSAAKVTITQSPYANIAEGCATQLLDIDKWSESFNTKETLVDAPHVQVSSSDLAYTIYTSGSTGKPKGVMVEHQNAHNFFIGMDERISITDNSVWLAVTSISFDISVLEILWSLSKGLKVVLYADNSVKNHVSKNNATAHPQTQNSIYTAYPEKKMGFSLFYWNVADEAQLHDQDKYRLVLEGAKFGDEHGFEAIWNPERHFHAFGGLFPNPAVTGAAIAAITKTIDIRAGSCVLPLHHPARVAEEWSVVDNLSNGRVALAIAAGWQPNDFVLKPENQANAKAIMFEQIDQLRRLWRGESVTFEGAAGTVDVRTLPRPIQKELPIWITSAGNPETYRQAGALGANILTHLLGQSLEQLEEKITIYRQARKEAGHDGDGKVTLMLHTLVGNDQEQVKNIARKPMKAYLKSAMFLVKDAAWDFPAFKAMSAESGKSLDEFFATISDEDLDGLLEFAFSRYFESSGLFGTVDHCVEIVDRAKAIGVTEIASLIDYGLDTDLVLQHLPFLNELKQRCNSVNTYQNVAPLERQQEQHGESITDLIESQHVTHFQCTPSMATMLAADEQAHNALAKLEYMMVGGEAFPPELAKSLLKLIAKGELINMYGPTETTIWSSTHHVEHHQKSISIGKPIANTQLYVVDRHMNLLPLGVPGELLIAGDGVVRGYLNRDDLTAEKFIANPFSNKPGARLYRTGDLAKLNDDGSLYCLGRIDHQVKIRGYRIELGEIEIALRDFDSVHEAAVIAVDLGATDKQLAAYVSLSSDDKWNEQDIKQQLLAKLPEFMVPQTFTVLERLPLTPNGKIDRKALPLPSKKLAVESPVLDKNAGDIEKQIVDIWQQALGHSNIGLDNNFFDIGGHSLLVVQVLRALRDSFDNTIQMTDLFRFTTIRAQADFIANKNQETSDSSGVATDRAAMRKNLGGQRRRMRKRS